MNLRIKFTTINNFIILYAHYIVLPFIFQFALHVYTSLVTSGQKYGLKHVGYYAMKAIRVEKFYAFWGQDLNTTTTPLECGRSWRVKFDVSS